jgi:hypothetical protein
VGPVWWPATPHGTTLLDLALDRTARPAGSRCTACTSTRRTRSGPSSGRTQASPAPLVEKAEDEGDELLVLWAHNTRMLLAVPDLFDYRDWCEGGLVRQPRRLRARPRSRVRPPCPPTLRRD